jgi:hypothetical protein
MILRPPRTGDTRVQHHSAAFDSTRGQREAGYGICRAMESRAMKPARLPTALGKRYAFPTAPTAPAAGKERPNIKNQNPIAIHLAGQSVTDVLGLICYLSSRLHTEGRMRGLSS